jgi:hypothetical protein
MAQPHDRADHDHILTWCRSDAGKRQTRMGAPVMRQSRDGRCRVIDVACFDAPTLADGADWTETLAALRANGYAL